MIYQFLQQKTLGPGTDFFDCGTGLDVVKDFNATEGDVHLDNCEVIQDDND